MNLIFSILSGLGFGFSMFFRKLGVKYLGMSAFIVEAIVEAILAFILVLIIFHPNISQSFNRTTGVVFAVASGISITIGVLSFYLAVKYGSSLTPSVLGPILAAIIASLLAVFFLKESLSFIKLIGLLITFAGLFIFLRL